MIYSAGKFGQKQIMAGYSKNLKGLEEHLDAGEQVDYSIFGAYETKILGEDNVRNGVLAATNKRIVFFAKKLFGYDFESFAYEKISSFESSKNMMGHKFKFHTSGNDVTIKWVNKGQIQEFKQACIERCGFVQPATSNTVGEDIAGQIEKLSRLMADGILTKDEFESKKKELLSRI